MIYNNNNNKKKKLQLFYGYARAPDTPFVFSCALHTSPICHECVSNVQSAEIFKEAIFFIRLPLVFNTSHIYRKKKPRKAEYTFLGNNVPFLCDNV